ncbi:siroheme synthase [Phenylobacterium sp.]|jgi:precorrin-2 dehydrogenase/sirohydrochlorin ferrochelatase|uniref:siroheme synthase n=1 Tax=Phenylobacterium sp. TaxID=1871053 RepID=UPI0037CAC3B2
MDAFPAFFPLTGRTVVVAGTGEGADAKVRLFAGSPARIARIAPERAGDPAAYAGAVLAFVAGGERDWAENAVAAARRAGVPVNAVDRPDLCDFTTPALVDRGEVVAAIGTGGASPMLATMLRQDLEARVPEGAGRIAALFRQMQDEVRSALPDPAARRRFLRRALEGPAAEAALAGDMATAAARFRAELSKGDAAAGRVIYIDARGPADHLSLRALRGLGAADGLILDDGADPDIVGMARRDADRLTPQDAAGLAALAKEGLVIARLTTADDGRAERLALAALGVATEVLPVAR